MYAGSLHKKIRRYFKALTEYHGLDAAGLFKHYVVCYVRDENCGNMSQFFLFRQYRIVPKNRHCLEQYYFYIFFTAAHSLERTELFIF